MFASEVGVVAVHGDVGEAFSVGEAVVGDRVDPPEDAVSDGRPVGSVEGGVDPSSGARWAERARSAVWTSILEGMQPRFIQVPPKAPGSTMATSQLSCSGPIRVLPEPAPTIKRSW